MHKISDVVADGFSPIELHAKNLFSPQAVSVCGSYPPGSSWQGYGTDMIFAECAGAGSAKVAGTREGEHDVYRVRHLSRP